MKGRPSRALRISRNREALIISPYLELYVKNGSLGYAGLSGTATATATEKGIPLGTGETLR